MSVSAFYTRVYWYERKVLVMKQSVVNSKAMLYLINQRYIFIFDQLIYGEVQKQHFVHIHSRIFRKTREMNPNPITILRAIEKAN